MKYIKLKQGWRDCLLIPCTQETAPLMAALSELSFYSYDRKEGIDIFTKATDDLEMTFINDPRFVGLTDKEQAIIDRIKQKEQDWYAQYTRADAAEKKVKELEAKLVEYKDKVAAL